MTVELTGARHRRNAFAGKGPSTMKVALINALYHPNVFGGAETSVQNLAQALVEAGIEVSVVTGSIDGRARSDVVNGVDCHYVDARQIGKSVAEHDRAFVDRVLWNLSAEFNPRPVESAMRVLDRVRPDLVHTNSITCFSSRIYPALASAGIPIVHTLRDYYLLCPLSTMYRRGRSCETRCLSCRVFAASRMRHSSRIRSVVGVSRFALDRHLEHGLFSRAREQTVIHNSYEASEANPPAPAAPPRGELRLGYLGRLHPIKGLDRLLDVLNGLPSRAWRFEIAGTGRTQYEEALKRRYASDRVAFLGWQDPAAFFERIDLLVVPSTWNEPLGRGVFEGYAHGVPVLAAAVGGIPEIVEDGRTGWLFDPMCPESARDALARLISQPERVRERRADCLRRARDFTHAAMAERYAAVYEHALGAQG